MNLTTSNTIIPANPYLNVNYLKRKREEEVGGNKKYKIYHLDASMQEINHISSLNLIESNPIKSTLPSDLNKHLKGSHIFLKDEVRLDLTIEQTRFLINNSNFIKREFEETSELFETLLDPKGLFILNLNDPDLIDITLCELTCLLNAITPADPNDIVKLIKIATFFDMPEHVKKYQQDLKQKILKDDLPLEFISKLLIQEKEFLNAFGEKGIELKNACEDYLNKRLCKAIVNDLDKEIINLEKKGLSQFIKNLNLSNSHLEDEQLLYIISAFPLETLNVARTSITANFANLENYRDVKGKNLRRINLSGCKINDDTFYLKGFDKLEKINLSYTDIDGSCLKNSSCQHFLRLLDLTGCERIVDEKVYLQEFKNLEKIKISNTDINGKFLEKVSCHHSLREINLDECANVTDKTLDLQKFINLEKIILCDTAINGSCFEKVSCYPSLIEINLCNCHSVTDEMLDLQKFKKLEKINLSNTRINGSCLKEMSYPSSVKEIELSYCERITDQTLSLQRFDHLEKINLSHTNVNSAFLEELPSQSSLKEINLTCCKEITDQTLSLQRFDHLEKIILSHTNVNGTFLKGLSCHHSLKIAEFYCTGLTDETFNLQGFNNLEEISVGYTNIDGSCLRTFSCQYSLKIANFSHCKRLTNQTFGIEVFTELKEIFVGSTCINKDNLKRVGLKINNF